MTASRLLVLLLLLLPRPVWAATGFAVVHRQVGRRVDASSRLHVSVELKNTTHHSLAGALCVFSWKGKVWGRLSDRAQVGPGQEVYLDGTVPVPKAYRRDIPVLAMKVSQYFLADLTVKKVTLPDRVAFGRPVDVSVWVQNRGTAQAGGVLVALFSHGRAVAQQDEFGAIAPGCSREVHLSWTPSAQGATELRVEIDPNGALQELDRSDNDRRVAVTVAPSRVSELAVTRLQIVTPKPRAQLPVQARVWVRNRSGQTVYRIPLVLRCDGGTVKSFVKRSPIKSHQTREYRINWIPQRAGRVLLSVTAGAAVADPFTHPLASRSLEILPPPSCDLRVVGVDHPRHMRVDQTYQLTVQVLNQGDLGAEGCTVQILEDGSRGSTAPQRFDLAPGATASIAVAWTPRRAGNLRLRAVVSSDGATQEADTANNEETVRVTVSAR